MSIIYSLVSKGNDTVLSSFTPHNGNFLTQANQILKRFDMTRTFSQFATSGHIFYTLIKEGFIFMVMVEASYQSRIAVSFLKQIQQAFFHRYDVGTRNRAMAHSLKDFNNILKQKMILFNDKGKVDKLSNLKNELTELQSIALKNMDKVIDRGEKIQLLVKKSQTMSQQSMDLNSTARRVRTHMWWKNKKIMIGVVILIIVLLWLLLSIICGFNFSKCG